MLKKAVRKIIVNKNLPTKQLEIKTINSHDITKMNEKNIEIELVVDKTTLPTTYVANTGSNSVSVVGPSSDTITVGQGPVAIAQVTQDKKQFVYVACEDGTVSVIQASNNTIIKTINLPGQPSFQLNRNILISSDGATLYIANQNVSANQGYISVIDTSSNTLTTSIKVGSNPITMALTNDSQPNSGLLYVINLGSHSVSVINTSNNQVNKSFAVSQDDPTYLAITLDNQYFIIGYTKTNRFHVGDLSTNTIVKTVSFSDDRHMRSLTLSLDGTLLYLGLRLGQDAEHQGSVIHPYKVYDDFSSLNEIVLNKNHQSDPFSVAQYQLADGYEIMYVGVTNSSEKYVDEILRQTATNSLNIVGHLPVGNFGGFLALSSDNQYIVTANTGGNNVTYIQTSSFTISEAISVQNSPSVLLILNN